MSPQEFQGLFATCRRCAWRLEARDTYDQPGERESLAEFLRTGRVLDTDDDREWYQLISGILERGARIGRVRLVSRPLTDYTRWEIAAYAGSVAAGEDVRLVDRDRLDRSWDDAPDVWVFDDQVAVLMKYDTAGAWLGMEQIDPAPIVAVREAILPYAVAYHDYRISGESSEWGAVPVSFREVSS